MVQFFTMSFVFPWHRGRFIGQLRRLLPLLIAQVAIEDAKNTSCLYKICIRFAISYTQRFKRKHVRNVEKREKDCKIISIFSWVIPSWFLSCHRAVTDDKLKSTIRIEIELKIQMRSEFFSSR